ncbi:LacI family DNA-binding transcriptional regulator [Streptomyces cyaneofuscatus]|uniref:LacI family DNA-binding transcriptional regulator n=1 Tax=Streptomyces cyaneofuscatus TaxID=66883 RepID=UPI0037A8389B
MTLDAVAREAGVSPATASRALNGTTRVRDELRSRARRGRPPRLHPQRPCPGPRQLRGQPYGGADLSRRQRPLLRGHRRRGDAGGGGTGPAGDARLHLP